MRAVSGWLVARLARITSSGSFIPEVDGLRFLASLFYSNNVVYGDFSPINGVTWSLEVEIHFYLIAPAVAVIFGVRDRVTRRAVLLALVVLFGLFAQFVV